MNRTPRSSQEWPLASPGTSHTRVAAPMDVAEQRLLAHVSHMAFIVGEPCIKCKYTDCAEVCPVNCFYEGPNMLVIDPDECIDCAVCIPECPVNAILPEEDVPEEQKKFTTLNAELARIWPVITDAKPGPEDADQWKDVKDKLEYLER